MLRCLFGRIFSNRRHRWINESALILRKAILREWPCRSAQLKLPTQPFWRNHGVRIPTLPLSRQCALWFVFAALPVLCSVCLGQQSALPNQPTGQSSAQLNVNWLYGAYLPKDAPLVPLTTERRFKLYLRQSFTTPGIYVKTLLFSVGDHINESPPEWGTGFEGYARRAGSRQAQFVIQNSFVALGDGILGYEPRYDRCRCTGFWSRTGHALARNLVTYNGSEQSLRPQFALYGGAFAAGVVAGTWKPRDRDLVAEGYRAVMTQVGFGFGANWLAEFAPDITRILRRKQPNKTKENRQVAN